MMLLPFQLNPREYSIFVVLQEDNLARMREHDPAELNIAKMGGDWQNRQLRDVIIGYATEPEAAQVLELCKHGRVLEALRMLSRGFLFRPDRGDHDDPYTSLKNPEVPS